MPYFDVSIPLKLKTLTYQYKEKKDLKGFAVQVPLRNQVVEGIVINKREKRPDEITQIRKIKAVLGEVYSKKFIDFLLWLSSYYFSEIGSVLRATFFEEVITFLKGKKIGKMQKGKSSYSEMIPLDIEPISLNRETFSKIINATNSGKYKTFLVHCPNFGYEIKLMTEIAKEVFPKGETILLIMPEIKDSQRLYEILKSNFNDKIVLLHSDMRFSELYSSIGKIIQDEAKVIVGTRSALFAPIKKLSLIMIGQESNWLYKAEETPRYHTRDCAVMRGIIENCPVVLTDIMPSTTSYYNALMGKYELIDNFNCLKHPGIKILRQPYQSLFHPETLLCLKLYNKDGILVIAPRSGYSLLRCSECGEVIKCEKCGYNMIFHKATKVLQCFRCNLVMKIYEQCPYCSGLYIHPIGTGVERLKEELRNIFSQKQVEIKDFNLELEQFHGLFVGQAKNIKKSYVPIFKVAIIVDFDFFVSIPDYRALENAFGRVLSISQLIKEDGTLFIQTRNPESDIFKFIRFYNFKDFYFYELKYRKEAGFPPYVRLIKLMIKLKKTAPKDVLEKIKELLKSHLIEEVIGPLKDKNREEFIFIVRSKDKKKLTEELANFIEKLRYFKGISFKIEVDPINLKI